VLKPVGSNFIIEIPLRLALSPPAEVSQPEVTSDAQGHNTHGYRDVNASFDLDQLSEWGDERRSEDLPIIPHAASNKNTFAEQSSSSESQLEALLVAAASIACSNPQPGQSVAASSQGHRPPVFHRDGGDAMRGVKDPMIAGDDY
jgi:hypothetical protein